MKARLTWFWKLLKESYSELRKNDPLRLSSSTAFFAAFAIIPIIVLLLNLLGTVFSQELLRGEIFNILRRMFGKEATSYLSTTLSNVQNMQEGIWITVGVSLFLIFIATTLFQVIHNSFNQIWQVKPKEDASFRFILKNRGLSLIIILFGGVLFLSVFLIDILIGVAGDKILLSSALTIDLAKILDLIFTLAIFTLWLAAVYKFLPDVHLPWKPVWIAAFFSAFLFLIGQYLIGKIIMSGNLNHIYGASASMVLLLLFIFYSSFILYFGFCMVKKLTEMNSYTVKSTRFAVQYEINELDENENK